MHTIFTIRNKIDDCFPIEKAWIIIKLGSPKPFIDFFGKAMLLFSGKYRLVLPDTICDPEDIETRATVDQTIDEGLLLTLGRAIDDFSNRIKYDSREHEDSSINFDLNIYSASECFLSQLHKWVLSPQDAIVGNVPGYFAKHQLNILRHCAKVTGICVEKPELKAIGPSDNPVEAIRMYA